MIRPAARSANNTSPSASSAIPVGPVSSTARTATRPSANERPPARAESAHLPASGKTTLAR